MSALSTGPTCPNHGVPLIDLPFPLPREGTGVCPISSCKFDFVCEIETKNGETVLVKTADGQLVPKQVWVLKGNE